MAKKRISPLLYRRQQTVVADKPQLNETPVEAVERLTNNLPPWRLIARWILVFIALYAIGWLLWQAGSALIPFLIGLIVAYLLMPFVNWLDRVLPRWFAILTVYVAATLLLVIGFAYVVPPVVNQIEQLFNSLPSIPELQDMGRDLIAQYQQIVPASIREQIDPALTSGLESLRTSLLANARSIGDFVLSQVVGIFNTITFLVGFLIIPIWLFYILNDQAQGQEFINRILHPRLRADFWNVWNIINKVLSDYIRGQLILCLAVGLAVGIGLLIVDLLGFQVNYILLLAIVAGITEFIPVLGPIIGSIPGIILGLFISPQTAIAVLIVYVAVQQLENNFLVPRIVGESVGVHPAILTVVLIAMGQVFGILGVVLSAPICAISRDLFIYAYSRLGGANATEAHATVEHRMNPPKKATVAETTPVA